MEESEIVPLIVLSHSEDSGSGRLKRQRSLSQPPTVPPISMTRSATVGKRSASKLSLYSVRKFSVSTAENSHSSSPRSGPKKKQHHTLPYESKSAKESRDPYMTTPRQKISVSAPSSTRDLLRTTRADLPARPMRETLSTTTETCPDLGCEASIRDILLWFLNVPQDKFSLMRFILAHGHFVESAYLISMLDEVYMDIQSTDVDGKLSFRIANIIKTWLEICYPSMDEEIRSEISELISTIAAVNMALADHLKESMERVRNRSHAIASRTTEITKDRPPSFSPTTRDRKKVHWKITEFHEVELARQLCLIEHDWLEYVIFFFLNLIK